MSVIKFSPIRHYLGRRDDISFPTFWNEVNDLMKNFTDAGLPDAYASGNFIPALDVKETDKTIVVTTELPGLTEKDIDVSIDDGVLTLKGEKKAEEKTEGQNYIRVERSFGSFHRSITLPSEVDAEKIDAVYKNGVLAVTLPKIVQERKEQKIKIKAQ